MHLPKYFSEDNPATLFGIMRENAFATIVTSDEEGLPVATSLPFLIKNENDNIVLQAHFAKSNPQWKQLENNKQVLVIFNGPHCYISPSWYKKPGVQTWDYVTVHAYGAAKVFDSIEQTAELLDELTAKYEKNQQIPWQSKGNYPANMLNAIVGFEIKVTQLQGKVKIGQNKSEEDLIGVINALQKSSSENDKAIATLIKDYLKSKD